MRRFRKLLNLLVMLERMLCGAMIVAMSALVTTEVVCRGFLGFSLLFTGEVTAYLLVAVAFLGIGVALHDRTLFRVDFVYGSIPAPIRAVLQLFFDVAALTFAIILTWQLIRLVLTSYERGVVAPTILRTPLYLPQTTMAIGMSIVVLILLSHVWSDIEELLRTPSGGTHDG